MSAQRIKADYQLELGKLLEYVAVTAIEIRRDYNSKATFDRVEMKGIRLADAIGVFQAIRAKAIAERDLSDVPAQFALLESN